MSWMEVLKARLKLPGNNLNEWREILSDRMGAEIWANELSGSIASGERVRHYTDFKRQVADFGTPVSAASKIRQILPTENEETFRAKRREIKDNYELILPKIKDFISAIDKRNLPAAAAQSQKKRGHIVDLLLEAANDLQDEEEVDWGKLESDLKKHFFGTKRKNKTEIIRLQGSLYGKNAQIIARNLPEGFEKLNEIFGDIDTEAEYENYTVTVNNLEDAVRYVEEFGEAKRQKRVGLEGGFGRSGESYRYTPLHIKELSKLQYSKSGNVKSRTNKVLMELLEGENINNRAAMEDWLTNIISKFSIREKPLKESYITSSWKKATEGLKDDDIGHISFSEDKDLSPEENEKKYRAILSNQIGDINNRQNKKWKDWLEKKKGEILSIGSSIPVVFKKFIEELHGALTNTNPGPKQTRMKNGMKTAFPNEEDIEDFISEKPELYSGFKHIGSAASPSGNTSKKIHSWGLPEENRYGEMVKEIWEAVNPEGTSERNFKILVRAYNTFEDQPENRDFTREAVIGDLMGEKDLSDNPLKESIDIFTTDLEKALAILIYDIYITGENPQKVLGGKDPVQRYRPSDIDMVEVIRLLRKAESPFSQLTTDIGVALRELEVKFNESKEGTVSDRTDKISAEPEILKDEIEKLAKSLESSLSKIKEGVLKAVQNKLLMVINNQQEYMSSVHSNILVELEDSEFIRRQ